MKLNKSYVSTVISSVHIFIYLCMCVFVCLEHDFYNNNNNNNSAGTQDWAVVVTSLLLWWRHCCRGDVTAVVMTSLLLCCYGDSLIRLRLSMASWSLRRTRRRLRSIFSSSNRCCSPTGKSQRQVLVTYVRLSGVASHGMQWRIQGDGDASPTGVPQCTETGHFEVQNGKKNFGSANPPVGRGIPLPTHHPLAASSPTTNDFWIRHWRRVITEALVFVCFSCVINIQWQVNWVFHKI